MKTDRRTFIKRVNWALAGIITALGFSCGKESDSHGRIYTVMGKVTNKATKEPISGIRVALGHVHYEPGLIYPMYGPPPVRYKTNVLTNAKGEFKLTDCFSDEEIRMVDNKPTLLVFASDNNSLFYSASLWVEFSRKPPRGYEANINVELTKIENQ